MAERKMVIIHTENDEATARINLLRWGRAMREPLHPRTRCENLDQPDICLDCRSV